MSQQGAIPPPPGVVPNFVDPSGEVHFWLKLAQFVCIPIIAIFVALRMYAKIFMLHEFYLEDWMCLISWILATAWFSLAIASADAGGGYHEWDVLATEMPQFWKINYAQMVMYSPMVLAIKLSILFMLIRFFAPFRKMVIFIYAFIGFLVAYTIAATISKICICMPIDTFWLGKDVTHGKCLVQLDIFLTDTVISVVSDLMILMLPVALVSMLKLPFRKKLKVTIILAAGGLACIATIVRLAWVIHYRMSPDSTWIIKRIDLLTNIEITVGICCACLPAIGHLATRVNRYTCERFLSFEEKLLGMSSGTYSSRGTREGQA